MSTKTNDIDKAVGARIRAYRKASGMSQSALASVIGVRFQQVQKYENGTNRVAASRLWQIADAFGINVVDLFQDITRPSICKDDLSEVVDLFKTLPAHRRAVALNFLRKLSSESSEGPIAENERSEPAGA